MTITIQPIKRDDGQFWISRSMDGCEMAPRGPWSNIDEAEAVAYRLASICRVLCQPVVIGGHLLTPAVPDGQRKRRQHRS